MRGYIIRGCECLGRVSPTPTSTTCTSCNTRGRDGFRSALAVRGVETMVHYPYLLHQQTLFRQRSPRELPVAERAAERILSLPLYPQLKMEEIQAVIDAILEYDA